MNAIQKLDGFLQEIKRTFGHDEKLANAAFHLLDHAPVLLEEIKASRETFQQISDTFQSAKATAVVRRLDQIIAQAEGR